MFRTKDDLKTILTLPAKPKTRQEVRILSGHLISGCIRFEIIYGKNNVVYGLTATGMWILRGEIFTNINALFQVQRDLLDAEMELFQRQQDGTSETAEIQKRVGT